MKLLETNTVLDLSNMRVPRKKILFANFPADGHFNPLTGLAVYLQSIGHEVRWYSSRAYNEKLKKLGITHYPFKKALEVADGNFDAVFPGRNKIKSQLKKLSFDIVHAFILRGPEYYDDIKEIHATFPFDLLVCDCAFTGIPFVKEKMSLPVIAIGVLPLTETSKDLPPTGLGLTPSNTFLGRRKQDILRFVADKVIFKKPNKAMNDIMREYGISTTGSNVFDVLSKKTIVLLQSGTPGFEYKRSDLSDNVQFIGPLLPFSTKKHAATWSNPKLTQYDKIILVTQGTVEKDISKLLVPALEAFKGSEFLLIVTTGGSGTTILKEKYRRYNNIIIEDFIPFADVMPHADVYITNGGYGGVMLGIKNNLPMVVAGIHEGKNEINARIGYFKLGINLRTEKPLPSQLKKSVIKILGDDTYAKNVSALRKEFGAYRPEKLCAACIDNITLYSPGLN